MLLLILLVLQAAPADVPDGGQFLRLVAGLHDEIQDVSLTCEGQIKRVGPERITGIPPDEFGRKFQAGYAYRQRDSATSIDMYQRDETPGAEVVRLKSSYLRDKVEEVGLAPGEVPLNAKPVKTKGASRTLDTSGSAHRILRLWYFRELNKLAVRVEPKRWEDCDGHRCLVVDVTSARLLERLWMDLERGGHPLRIDQYHDGNLRMRTDVVLGRVHSRGRDYWLPVSGITETFKWKSSYHREPIYRETYQVVGGSVVINAGLGDDTFMTTKEARRAAPGGEGELARQFRETPSRPVPPGQRTDPEGVRERLEGELAEADRQAAMLQASAPSRDWWSWTGLFQALGLAAGIALLVAAFLLRRRFVG